MLDAAKLFVENLIGIFFVWKYFFLLDSFVATVQIMPVDLVSGPSDQAMCAEFLRDHKLSEASDAVMPALYLKLFSPTEHCNVLQCLNACEPGLREALICDIISLAKCSNTCADLTYLVAYLYFAEPENQNVAISLMGCIHANKRDMMAHPDKFLPIPDGDCGMCVLAKTRVSHWLSAVFGVPEGEEFLRDVAAMDGELLLVVTMAIQWCAVINSLCDQMVYRVAYLCCNKYKGEQKIVEFLEGCISFRMMDSPPMCEKLIMSIVRSVKTRTSFGGDFYMGNAADAMTYVDYLYRTLYYADGRYTGLHEFVAMESDPQWVAIEAIVWHALLKGAYVDLLYIVAYLRSKELSKDERPVVNELMYYIMLHINWRTVRLAGIVAESPTDAAFISEGNMHSLAMKYIHTSFVSLFDDSACWGVLRRLAAMDTASRRTTFYAIRWYAALNGVCINLIYRIAYLCRNTFEYEADKSVSDFLEHCTSVVSMGYMDAMAVTDVLRPSRDRFLSVGDLRDPAMEYVVALYLRFRYADDHGAGLHEFVQMKPLQRQAAVNAIAWYALLDCTCVDLIYIVAYLQSVKLSEAEANVVSRLVHLTEYVTEYMIRSAGIRASSVDNRNMYGFARCYVARLYSELLDAHTYRSVLRSLAEMNPTPYDAVLVAIIWHAVLNGACADLTNLVARLQKDAKLLDTGERNVVGSLMRLMESDRVSVARLAEVHGSYDNRILSVCTDLAEMEQRFRPVSTATLLVTTQVCLSANMEGRQWIPQDNLLAAYKKVNEATTRLGITLEDDYQVLKMIQHEAAPYAKFTIPPWLQSS